MGLDHRITHRMQRAYPRWYALAFETSPHAPCPLHILYLADIKANATCRNSINPSKEAEAQQRKRMVEYQEEREEVIGDMMSRHPSILEDIPATHFGLYADYNMQNSFPADKPVAGQMSCPPLPR